MIYLDNAATTRVDPLVLESMLPYLQNEYGNPGTVYKLGRNARAAVDFARQQVADLINASPEQIVFTSGGTESNNSVFLSATKLIKQRKYIVSSRSEHDSVINSIERLDGFATAFVSTDKHGVVDVGQIKTRLEGDPGLVSIMYVNNETGAENPIEDIGRLCNGNGALFHTDCVQAAGGHEIDVRKIGCDFLSISSHKIHGPKGVGALFVKNPEIFKPLIIGGAGQEFGLRGGTENVAGIVGFGEACRIAKEQMVDINRHISTIKQGFYTELLERMKWYEVDDRVHINGESVMKSGKILNLRFDGIDSETLLLMLDAQGICVSAGSACRSNESEPSRVLLAMGLTPEEARSSIRLSFSKYNTEQEMVLAAEAIASSVYALIGGDIDG